ncbi:helix-turn-helix transcriptional regulator [Ursidibacter arcticus]
MTIKYLKINEVTDKLGIGKSTLYEWIDPKSPRFKPDFPKRVKMGVSTRFVESEITAYQQAQMNAR